METALKFGGKQGINRPLTGHARLPCEIRAHNHNIEMCFPLGPGAGVAGMHVGVVPYFDSLDIEPGLKGRLDTFCAIHQFLQPLVSPTYLRTRYCLGLVHQTYSAHGKTT